MAVTALVAGLSVATFWVAFFWSAQRKWQRFGSELGFKAGVTRLGGTFDGFEVTVGRVLPRQRTFLLRVGGAHRLGTLRARKNDTAGRVSAAVSGDLLTGDPDFDAQVVLQGDELGIAAALTVLPNQATKER